MALYRCGGSSTKVLYLGTGTSFDIKTIYPNVNYKKLTADNFITPTASCNGTSVGASYYNGTTLSAGASGGSFNLTKSYDSETGILTINGAGLSVGCHAYPGSESYRGDWKYSSAGISVGPSYLVLGKIEEPKTQN